MDNDMGKRFTDTDKYKKSFIRGLQGAYKLLWDYLYHECNHAGIWEVEWDVMQSRIGLDMPVNYADALHFFNCDDTVRIIEIEGGKKWFIPPFIDFQYGELNPENRAHYSVIQILKKYNLFSTIKPLTTPLQGCKDKDKDKDKDMDKDKEGFVKIKKQKSKAFIPPTQQEVIDYITANPELSNVPAVTFWKGFNDGGWVDTQGNPVRNWKMKLRTWSSHAPKIQSDTPPPTKPLIKGPSAEEVDAFMKSLPDCGLDSKLLWGRGEAAKWRWPNGDNITDWKNWVMQIVKASKDGKATHTA